MSSQNTTGGAESTESTGLTSGGILTINANPALLDISDGEGFAVDNYTDPENATKLIVTWSGQTDIPIANIVTQDYTFIGINSNGSVVQQSDPFTDSQERDIIVLGMIIHSDNATITAVLHNPNTRFDLALQVTDFVKAIGGINTFGNVFSANGANLSVDKSAGTIYRIGSNYAVSKQNPSTTDQSLSSPQTLLPQYRDGSGGFITEGTTSFVDVGQYDDNSGTLATVPNNARWQAQRLWVLEAGLTIIIYDQNTYSDMAEAEASITSETFETDTVTTGFGVLRGWLIVSKDTTDLSNSSQAKFITASSIASTSEPPTVGGGTINPSASQLNTGLNNGGILSVASGTTFSIEDGNGWVVNNYDNPDNPIERKVTWSGLTGITVTNIGIQPRTFVGIDENTVVIQQSTDFTFEQRRDIIVLGAVIHTDLATVTSTSTFPVTRFDLSSQFVDFVKVVGTVNVHGNSISANAGANLSIDRSQGSMYRLGANYATDKKNPSIVTDIAASPQTFTTRYRDGGGGFTISAPTTSADPDNWDDGTGSLNTVANNWWTVQRVYVFPSGVATIMYGQAEYQNLDDALDGLSTEVFEIDPVVVANAVLRGYIVVQDGTTDLTDTADALFVEGNKFGTASAGGVASIPTTLQQAYNNSVAPQTVLDGAKGAWAIRDNAAPLGTNLFEIADSPGTTKFFAVDANGIVAPAATVAPGDLVLARDISDSNTLKEFTAQSIADLGGGGSVTSVSGTSNRITSTGGSTPVIDIAATYVGQTSITTLGTIVTGVWTGTDIAIADGGTGSSTASGARTNLGLGTIATQNANAVVITGGTIAGTTATTFTFSTGSIGVGVTATTMSIDNTSSAVATTAYVKQLVKIVQTNVACNSNITYTQDIDTNHYFKLTVTSNCTLDFTFNGSNVQSMCVELINAGAFTVALPAGMEWPGGTAPTFTSSGRDIIVVWNNGDSLVSAALIGQDYS